MFLEIENKPAGSCAAIDDSGESICYGELVEASYWMSSLIGSRELVFCFCENRIGALTGYIALYENKAVSLLLDAAMNRQLISRLINIYQPSYLWLPEEMAGEFEAQVIGGRRDYVLAKTDYPAPSLYEDLSFLLTTSGSTGSPKLVRHRYGNLEANARAVAEIFKWDESERGICHLPMQYTMGLNVINSHLYAGATALLTTSPLTSALFWDFVQKQKGTNFTGVPYSYEILFKMKFMKMELPHLRTYAEGGGKLSDGRFRTLAEYAANTGRRFFATFGTTETSSRLAWLPPEMALDKCGSIGRTIPGGELFLADDHGTAIQEVEAEGELCYRGPNVTLGYAQSKEDLMRGDDFQGVFHTGDMARRDSDRCCYIIGRKKRFLKLFGLRISLDQCELLISDRFSAECACSGNDERMEIYLTDQRIAEDVRNFLSEKTGIPRSSLQINIRETIPRNQSGKIDYIGLTTQGKENEQ